MKYSIGKRIRSHLHSMSYASKLSGGKLSGGKLSGGAAPLACFYQKRAKERSQFVLVQALGCHDMEMDAGVPFVWTSGNATLTCSLARPSKVRWVWIDLCSGPNQQGIRISINDQAPTRFRFRGKRRIRLRVCAGHRVHSLVIQIESDTFVPSKLNKASQDDRLLGVQVGCIRLARHWWHFLFLPSGKKLFQKSKIAA